MDLRTMLRSHVVGRSLDCMSGAARRREEAVRTGAIGEFGATIRGLLESSHRDLTAGPGVDPPVARTVS